MADECEADVIGYGGAAGGGKSDLLLGRAFRRHRRAVIFRQQYNDLTDLIDRGNEILEGQAAFISGSKRRWELPSGTVVKLGAVMHDKDLKKWRGRPHDFIGIDEAADFSEKYFRFLTGWLRTTDPSVRPQVLLTFNPPTDPGGEWIIRYFGPWLDPNHPNPAQPGELRWFARIDDSDVEIPFEQMHVGQYQHGDGKSYPTQSRTFIRARVEDNPSLMATGYDTHLEGLPEPLRSQLRFGDFTIGLDDDQWQVIPTKWVLEAQERWRAQEAPTISIRVIGGDIARGGKDETVLAPVRGNWFDELRCYAGTETPDGDSVAIRIAQALADDAHVSLNEDGENEAYVYLDAIGIGAAAVDSTVKLHARTVGLNVSAPSNYRDKSGLFGMLNIRAEAYWALREALDPNSGEDIALPPSRELRVDLCAPRWKLQSGKVRVEAKEDVKKRISRSPDRGDAVVIAWHAARHSGPLILWGDEDE